MPKRHDEVSDFDIVRCDDMRDFCAAEFRYWRILNIYILPVSERCVAADMLDDVVFDRMMTANVGDARNVSLACRRCAGPWV